MPACVPETWFKRRSVIWIGVPIEAMDRRKRATKVVDGPWIKFQILVQLPLRLPCPIFRAQCFKGVVAKDTPVSLGRNIWH
jgi:hypothetical protein